MRYLSLFSGIEAATVAWQPLGCASPNDLVPETAERSGTYRRRLHAASGPGSGSPGQDANCVLAYLPVHSPLRQKLERERSIEAT